LEALNKNVVPIYVLFLLGVPGLGNECPPEAAAGQNALLQRKKNMETMEQVESIKEAPELPFALQPAPGLMVNQTAMFQGCSAKSKLHPQLPDVSDTMPSLATMNHAVKLSGCPAGTEPLINFARSTYTQTCCPRGHWRCSGCGNFSLNDAGNDGWCNACQHGFTWFHGWCLSCADIPGWRNPAGLTCAQISGHHCNDVKVKGLSSNEACCK